MLGWPFEEDAASWRMERVPAPRILRGAAVGGRERGGGYMVKELMLLISGRGMGRWKLFFSIFLFQWNPCVVRFFYKKNSTEKLSVLAKIISVEIFRRENLTISISGN